jgi:hypothetical protein
VSKEHAYAYEAGYRDGSIHYELEHCPACKNVADLQEALADNAKLRELVRDYERCTMHADCGLCEYDGKLSTHCPFSPCFPDADELRELRVEVDA